MAKQINYRNVHGEYYQYAANIRGRIINDVAEMERSMDNFICHHFCNTLEKRAELMEIILATKHITYQAKCDIFKTIILKGKLLTINQANKVYDKLVNKIGTKRNMIAHFPLDMSLSSMRSFENDNERQKTIYLVKYDKTKSVIPFTKDDQNELYSLISAVKGLVTGFWGQVLPKFTTHSPQSSQTSNSEKTS